MIKKIAHLADIHIRKSPTRNEEYRYVFNNLYKSLKKEKPDIIVLVGDIVNDYLDLQGEQLILVSEFLTNLSKIAPVRVTRGNHDILKKALKRTDPIEAIVTTLNNKNIIYYNSTGFFEDDNIVWAVWHHGDKKSPWKRGYKKIEDKTYIDLYHDPIQGSKSASNYEFTSLNLSKVDAFKGDFLMAGDIHLQQYLNKDKTKAYCGSLIAQDFSEGDENFHGYLLWDVESNEVEEIEVENEYSYKTIKVNSFTDFDDLDFEIDNPTKYMRIRVVWNCLPNTKNGENIRKIKEYLNSNYKNIIILTHKKDYIEEDVIDVVSDEKLDNITSQEIQHSILSEYFEKIGTEKELIESILKLDNEINDRLKLEKNKQIEWDIIKVWGKNLFSYDEFDIDWRNLNGITQITGENTGGKTTLLSKSVSYVLFGKTSETIDVEKNGDARFVNFSNNAKYCEGSLVIEANGVYYGIKRRTDLKFSKAGDVTGAPTAVNYYLLSSPDDELNESNDVDNLNDDRKSKTQNDINNIIGSYDNFIRIMLTTADSLNAILSNKRAEFIDSVLFDSGLDIFDNKTNEFKQYLKEKNTTPRIVCDITKTKENITILEKENQEKEKEIDSIQNEVIPSIKKRITAGQKYIQEESNKLFKIDDEISSLDIEKTNESINNNLSDIENYEKESKKLENDKTNLVETYDENRLDSLLKKKEDQKRIENEKKLHIKNIEREILEVSHKIEILNGEILNISKEGTNKKNEGIKLKESKICPTCGQLVSEDAQKHIEIELKKILVEIDGLVKKIETKKNEIKTTHEPEIHKKKEKISKINDEIIKLNLDLEKDLAEIGVLTNEKNDVEKRKEIDNTIKNNVLLVENLKLKNDSLSSLLERHETSKLQIIQNTETNKKIEKGTQLINELQNNLNIENEKILNLKNVINTNINNINTYKKTIIDYKEQLRVENMYELYKKAIHRNGIPTQLLQNKIIPLLNREMESLLSEMPFSVWLEPTELKLKLKYNDSDVGINAISGSGKERTFSSIALKFALNQINMKSKPTVMLLDEMMGKLTGDSVDEFIMLLNSIKEKLNKLLIIEHNHELNPDHIIHVKRNEKGISEYEIM
jgi:hypothetical protein